jgi:hypothetical protein
MCDGNKTRFSINHHTLSKTFIKKGFYMKGLQCCLEISPQPQKNVLKNNFPSDKSEKSMNDGGWHTFRTALTNKTFFLISFITLDT